MVKKVSDGVGKKIVEALKKQSEIEITPVAVEPKEQMQAEELYHHNDNHFDELQNNDLFADEEEIPFSSSFSDDSEAISSIDLDELATPPAQPSFATNSFSNYQQAQHPTQAQDSFIKELDNFEIPSNIAVLKKLISQLPSGVSRHTGAQIIKQTMEALGISMKSVLQEAQQVQEGLNNSAKECYSTVQEYKKQISHLEKQAQNYQRQYSALNELISLFIQTGI